MAVSVGVGGGEGTPQKWGDAVGRDRHGAHRGRRRAGAATPSRAQPNGGPPRLGPAHPVGPPTAKVPLAARAPLGPATEPLPRAPRPVADRHAGRAPSSHDIAIVYLGLFLHQRHIEASMRHRPIEKWVDESYSIEVPIETIEPM